MAFEPLRGGNVAAVPERVGSVTMVSPGSPADIGTCYFGRINEATEQLLNDVGRLSDDDLRAPSRLPGWSRGHVLTHLARNADGARHLLTWARTGVETPEYESRAARAADVESGASRATADVLADLRNSSAAFAAEYELMPPEAWNATVRWSGGHPGPAWWIAAKDRYPEVLLHHVDADIGYEPRDWPADFVAELLTEFMTRGDVPPMRLLAEDTSLSLTAHPDDASVEVRGPQCLLLAWVTGRSRGRGLTVRGDRQLPSLPPLYSGD